MTEPPDNLDGWLTYIEGVHPVGWDLGLDRITRVARKLNVLNPAPVTLLVAGTNGKGSAVQYLDAFARSAGLSTGLSTSPHLLSFNERIVVNGSQSSDKEIIDAFRDIEHARGEITLTYFEFAALASMLIFKRHQVDVAILEIGLGGRLDAMNIVSPDLSIITSISLDHQAWLGDTREAIAREKAGIMREGVRCIVADRDPPDSLLQHARETGTPLELIGTDFELDPSCSPALPADSFAAAMQAAERLGWSPDRTPAEIAAETSLPGRGSWLQDVCRVLLDVAHNPAAAERLARSLETLAPAASVHALLGMYADKDIEAVTAALTSKIKTWHLTALDDPRAASTEELQTRLVAKDKGKVSVYANISDAVAGVRKQAAEDDLIVVFGSFPVVAGAMQLIGSSYR